MPGKSLAAREEQEDILVRQSLTADKRELPGI